MENGASLLEAQEGNGVMGPIRITSTRLSYCSVDDPHTKAARRRGNYTLITTWLRRDVFMKL